MDIIHLWVLDNKNETLKSHIYLISKLFFNIIVNLF